MVYFVCKVKGDTSLKNNQLEEIYAKYHTEVYLYALSFCQNHYQAQDLVSDTFYKAMLALDESKDYIKFWLFRVCKNLYLDSVRKNRSNQSIDNYEHLLSNEETSLDKVINNEERIRVYYQVLKLPPSYKEIITLYYYCDFSLREISSTIDISEGAAKTLLFRARRRLKIALEAE